MTKSWMIIGPFWTSSPQDNRKGPQDSCVAGGFSQNVELQTADICSPASTTGTSIWLPSYHQLRPFRDLRTKDLEGPGDRYEFREFRRSLEFVGTDTGLAQVSPQLRQISPRLRQVSPLPDLPRPRPTRPIEAI